MTFGGSLRRAVTACKALALSGKGKGKGRAMTAATGRRVLVLGTRAAGKSELLRSLQESGGVPERGESVSSVPTVGFGVESVGLADVCLTCWDVGDQRKLEPLRRQLYADFDAFIFVVDASSEEQVDCARRELALALAEDDWSECQLVVAANKQDLPNALTAEEVADRLGLNGDTCGRLWSVVGTSATSGCGLQELLEEVTAEPSRSAVGATTEDEALALLDVYKDL